MTTVLLTTTSASPQTWNVPADAPAGTPVTIEAWGAGAGASGGSTSFRAGGAGGSYASTPYVITSADVASGIAYTVQAGSAGTAAANPTAGPDTLFGPTLKNLVSNNTNYGAVVGGAFPTNWAVSTPNGLTVSVAGLGTDAGTGLPYIDISYVGTTNATAQTDIIFTANNSSPQVVPASASVSYTCSAYLSATNTTGLTGMAANVNWSQVNGTFISNPNIFTTTISSSFTRRSGTVTSPALTGRAYLIYRISYNTGAAINLTLRFAGVQFEQAASASAVQSTPAGLLARGGAAPSGTTGGAALNAGLSMGTILFAGGGGASNASGGGGGGSAGAAGAGATATTATGGAADAGSGGAANTSNVEGGGGGTASASGHVGGDPGGGAGANTSTGSGGTGGRGQIRITYASLILTPQIDNLQQFIPVMAQ